MTQLFANNATSALAVSASNSATTLTLTTGHGAKFPSPTGGDYFMLTLVGLDSNSNEAAWEIVKVTGRSNDVLTVVRAQESTSAVSWASGTRVEARATAGTFGALSTSDTPTFTGTIKGDFSNATASSRVAFQSATTNGATIVSAKPNGTGTASYLQAFNAQDADNAAYVYLGISSSLASINSAKTGTGTSLPLAFLVNSAEALRISSNSNLLVGTTTDDGSNKLQVSGSAAVSSLLLAGAYRETKVAMGANDINLSTGNYFTKTISGITTLTVSNVPTTGTAASFILDLTNGGSAAITWWAGMKWAGGTAPTLTSAGRDVLGFFTHDGGTTWTGLLLGKDVK